VHTLFPTFAFPRYVAGGPLKANVYKCQLKRIDPSDYAVSFTAAEMQRLQSIFPREYATGPGAAWATGGC